MTNAMLQPVVVLVGWTLAILLVLFKRRFPALKAAGIDLRKGRGGRGSDLEGRVPPAAQWPAHNFTHLVEQPTLFYALAIAIAVAGRATALDLVLAWTYVALRIVHSVWQLTVNRVPVRFALFLLSTLVLIGLAARAAAMVF